MRDDAIKSINFKQVRTIITKENSDLEEWRNCNGIPFMLLNAEDTYSITFVVFREHTCCGYAVADTRENLYKRLIEKIDDAIQVFITITSKDKSKNQWFISRD